RVEVVAPLGHCRPWSITKFFSALDVGLRPIIACRYFVMPTTSSVFVRDAHRLARNDLFLRCALGRSAGHVVGWKGLGEHAVHPVGPTAVVLDDLINDLGHGSLLILMGGGAAAGFLDQRQWRRWRSLPKNAAVRYRVL